MLLGYEFSSDLSQFIVIDDGEAKNSIDTYMETIIYNTVRLLTNKTTFGMLKIPNKDYKEFIIKIKNKKGLNIKVSSNHIKVTFGRDYYLFRHNYTKDGGVIYLEELQINTKNQVITEIYLAHEIVLKIAIKNRLFELCIPYDTDNTVSFNLFSQINYNSNLNTLKNIYSTIFAPGQDNYNFYKVATKLSITTKNNKEEIAIQGGKTISYHVHLDMGNYILDAHKSLGEETSFTLTGIKPPIPLNLSTIMQNILVKAEKYVNSSNKNTLRRPL